jgi:hypothetical protein
MGEDRKKGGLREPISAECEEVRGRIGVQLYDHEAFAHGALLQFGEGFREREARAHLSRNGQSERKFRGLEGVSERGEALENFGVWRREKPREMRCAKDVFDSIGDQIPRQRECFRFGPRPVVDARKKMAMSVDHCVLAASGPSISS